ncbi:MAG: ethanolamine ammonia-lyase subunit EutB, partial [Deltaproteobacteria bacterium]|nr:ethanolamine ammonia-lyase subunit EutB [Deltaproteobacteria bacterium]
MIILLSLLFSAWVSPAVAVTIEGVNSGEDVFAYVSRIKGKFDQTLYRQVMGAANAFKEGDATIKVAADNETTRVYARMLLANTEFCDILEHPRFVDELQKIIWQT